LNPRFVVPSHEPEPLGYSPTLIPLLSQRKRHCTPALSRLARVMFGEHLKGVGPIGRSTYLPANAHNFPIITQMQRGVDSTPVELGHPLQRP
jgi:hypothetical protein